MYTGLVNTDERSSGHESARLRLDHALRAASRFPAAAALLADAGDSHWDGSSGTESNQTPVLIGPFGAGRIHETFAIPADRPAFLLQRINTHVFPDPIGLTANADLVSSVTSSPLQFERDEQSKLVVIDDGGAWRLVRFIANSCVPSEPVSPQEAASIGHAFGAFAAEAAAIDPDTVLETIPHFHDTPRRYRALQDAASSALITPEIRAMLHWVAERADRLGAIHNAIEAQSIPRRIAHNDAKADNILVDCDSGHPIGVIDLDTVMPGSPLYDLGDLLRTVPVGVGEDEPDASLVGVDWGLAESVRDGFLEGCSVLTDQEVQLAVAAGWVITMEQGIRYLTDYLSGDTYYGASYEGQNAERARNQFALVDCYEKRGWAP